MANQNQKFLGALVEHAPSEQLSTAEKQYWIDNGRQLAGALLGLLKRNLVTVAVGSTLLTFIGTVSLSATTEPFVVAEKFTGAFTEGKISFVHKNFIDWFLVDGGCVERVQAARTLYCVKLRKNSSDLPIIADLDGYAETFLTDLWELLKVQARGEKGTLFTNDLANIFFIRDTAGVLRVVTVRWNGTSWCVGANPVGMPGFFTAGGQVFSHYPCVDTV